MLIAEEIPQSRSIEYKTGGHNCMNMDFDPKWVMSQMYTHGEKLSR